MAAHDHPENLLALLPDATILLAPDGEIVWANVAAEDLSGLRDAWRGTNVLDLLHPDDHAVVLNAIVSIQGDGSDVGDLIDVRIRHTSGAWRPIELRGRVLDDDHMLVALRATADRQALELGSGGHERLRALVHHAHTILVSLDRDGVIRSVNAHVSRVLGWDAADVVGRPFAELIATDDRFDLREALRSGDTNTRIELRALDTEGHIVHLDVNIADLRADEVQDGYTISANDVTDLKTTQRALRHMAEHDALTGLLNRRALLAKLDDIVGDGYQHEIVILFCDLDGFKPINDRFGHAAGDQVLIEVARRLERSVRPGDLVGRLGGDEFVVVLPRMDPGQADQIQAAIRDALTDPIVAADQVVEVDVSIGCATTGDSPTAARLLAAADDAMYAVKRTRASR